MDRREFIQLSALGLAGLGFSGKTVFAEPCKHHGEEYNMVLLGDTHFDTAPDSVYHTGYSDPDPNREAAHRKEFVRNAEMWQDRCPRLVKRAACLVDDDTKMVLHMGDLIQGDTSGVEAQKKMLSDAFDYLKDQFGPLPLVTVAGNHDIRGRLDSEATQGYEEYMMPKIGEELGLDIRKTSFSFMAGPDAYIVIDFTHKDDEEVEKLFEKTKGARYTFVIIHGPVFPCDCSSPKWYYHGKDKTPDARRHFRELFAKRNVIVLCGHTHFTEFADWYGDGGRITQFTLSSVWSKESLGKFHPDATKASQYGNVAMVYAASKSAEYRSGLKDLFGEYREGMKSYIHSYTAGSAKMHVSDKGVSIEFYAGDSSRRTETFILR